MSNEGMNKQDRLWEKDNFTPEVNKVIEDNIYILNDFYHINKIFDTDERDFLCDRFLIACSRYNGPELKISTSIENFLNACLSNSRHFYWINKSKSKSKDIKSLENLTKEEQDIFELSEIYYNSDEPIRRDPKEIFAHQFICNLKPSHQKLLYYRFYYPVGDNNGLSWQGVSKMIGTSAQSCKNIFNNIKRISKEEVFIDFSSTGYGTKILNTRTGKIRDKNPMKDLVDIFKEIEKE